MFIKLIVWIGEDNWIHVSFSRVIKIYFLIEQYLVFVAAIDPCLLLNGEKRVYQK